MIKLREIKHEDLLRQVHYDPLTGVFTRLVATAFTPAGTRMDKMGKNFPYPRVFLGSWVFRAHRLAWFYMTKEWPEIIDHIDRDVQNHKFANLRSVTNGQNLQNRLPRKNNPTGFAGVRRAGKKFVSSICLNYKQTKLGSFSTPEEAHAAYMNAKREFHPFYTHLPPVESA